MTTAHVIDDPAQLTLIYDDIMATSFPATELISREELLAGAASGRLRVRAVTDDDDEIAAIAVTKRAGETAVMLDYFATRPGGRGKGVGSRMLAALLELIRERDRPQLILAEVEHPDYHDAHETFGDPRARLRFYDRLGARVIDVPYFLGPVEPDADALHGMLLLALWVDPAVETDGMLSRDADLARVLEHLTEGIDASSHPVHRLLDAAEGPVRLLAIDEHGEAEVSSPL